MLGVPDWITKESTDTQEVTAPKNFDVVTQNVISKANWTFASNVEKFSLSSSPESHRQDEQTNLKTHKEMRMSMKSLKGNTPMSYKPLKTI